LLVLSLSFAVVALQSGLGSSFGFFDVIFTIVFYFGL